MTPGYVPLLMVIVGSVVYLLTGRPSPTPNQNAWLRTRVGELALSCAAAGFFAIAFEYAGLLAGTR